MFLVSSLALDFSLGFLRRDWVAFLARTYGKPLETGRGSRDGQAGKWYRPVTLKTTKNPSNPGNQKNDPVVLVSSLGRLRPRHSAGRSQVPSFSPFWHAV